MTERPILFSTRLVQAILEGRKSQTRRVVRFDPQGAEIHWHRVTQETSSPDERGRWGFWSGSGRDLGSDGIALMHCPFGGAGMRLWVRETWCANQSKRGFAYRADFHDHADTRLRWKPSIHMPREACRLRLEVTASRPERLHSITEEDAIAEGVRLHNGLWCGSSHATKGTPKAFQTATTAFADLWDSLNAKRDFGWSVNPWVWVVEFRRLTEQEALA